MTGASTPVERAGGKGRIAAGAAIGTVAQLLASYGGFGLVGVIILGVPVLVAGVYATNHPAKPLGPPPPVSEERAYKTYKSRLRSRKFWAWVDFVAWGLSMILTEAIVVTVFLLFGFRFPIAPGP